jgi:hydroxymethylglutaryl-CoA reductase
MNSRLPQFYQLSHTHRLNALLEACPTLNQADLDQLTQAGQLGWDRADKMVENCIGVFELPVGLGLNFVINDQQHLIPMAVEEPSIIAAVSHVARLVRPFGGFKADADPSIMIAQIQLVGCPDLNQAKHIILNAKEDLITRANQCHPNLKQRGGGAQEIEVRLLPAYDDQGSEMCIVHLLVDCVDAMGANAVNTMAERLAP